MQKWEYIFRHFTDAELGIFEEIVQAFGTGGWELVQVVLEQSARPIDWQGELPVAIFKRPTAS
jgi:hypothetical protein